MPSFGWSDPRVERNLQIIRYLRTVHSRRRRRGEVCAAGACRVRRRGRARLSTQVTARSRGLQNLICPHRTRRHRFISEGISRPRAILRTPPAQPGQRGGGLGHRRVRGARANDFKPTWDNAPLQKPQTFTWQVCAGASAELRSGTDSSPNRQYRDLGTGICPDDPAVGLAREQRKTHVGQAFISGHRDRSTSAAVRRGR